MMRSLHRGLAAALVAAVVACGDSSGPDVPTIEETQFAASLGIDLAQMTKTSSGLYYRDLTVGTGATAIVGKQVSLYYNGYLADGTQFDSRSPGQAPFVVTVGSGGVIPGFDEGVRGMAVGGVRQIIIPPNLGYGSNGSGPIPPNAILVFRLQVTAIQ